MLKRKELPVCECVTEIRIACVCVIFISRRALAREGDYEMMSVCVSACVCVCALDSHADSSKTATATDFL